MNHPVSTKPAERPEGEATSDTFYEEWDRVFHAFENCLQVTKADKETPDG